MPKLTQSIPAHLRAYIVEQEYDKYTAIDHATWRMILRLSQKFFAEHAHQKYLDGLRETGISIDRIPRISEMDELLKRFQWRAVAVSGFIPPAIFMEFLSRGILPIACDMRKIENLTYTPAPDIVHEAAGHAPIIADSAYSEYLRHYGEVSQKAIFTEEDMNLYLAIRRLSEIKENPQATPAEVQAAQQRLDEASRSMGEPSEAAQLARMNWWTVEYGLVGDTRKPKIYGAGLLSSLGESYHCLDEQVEKIPLDVNCIQTAYDITRPQPQLFVARDFAHLMEVLDDFADTMAFRRGGVESLRKARNAKVLTTTVLENGLQISGVLTDVEARGDLPVFLRFNGPVQLSYRDQELEGHGVKTHAHGFSSPLGEFPERHLPWQEIQARGELEFDSGFRLEGRCVGEVARDGKRLLLNWRDCTVWDPQGKIVFRPEWGAFDLAIGSRVVSVFGGVADGLAYFGSAARAEAPPLARQKTNLTAENQALNAYYQEVRTLRESGGAWGSEAESKLLALVADYSTKYAQDWLLRYEILELLKDHPAPKLEPLRQKWETELRALAKTKTPEGEVLSRAFQYLY